jgi:hypothetical protein
VSVRRLGERPENEKKWDKPFVPMPQVEHQLFSKADVQRLFARLGVATEAGPVVELGWHA